MRRGKRKTYWEKLQDKRWQKKRLEILQRDNFCCQYPNCPSTTSMLDVHHKAYLSNTNPWDYPEYALITYCQEHHQIEQRRMEAAHLAIASNPQLIDYCISNAIENPNRIPQSPQKIEPVKDVVVGRNLFAEMRRAIEEGRP